LSPISIEKVSKILKREPEDFYRDFSSKLKKNLEKHKHYFGEDKSIFFTERGLSKLAILLQNEELLDFLDNLNSDNPKDDGLKNIYKNIQESLESVAEKIYEERNSIDLDKIDKFLTVLEKFINLGSDNRKFNPLLQNEKERSSLINNMSDFASETRDIAYKFASKTEDDAYKFASNMGKDAYNFTSETRDKAHDFVMKTEDDAYKFASNMGKDAYNFASKGMDYGYRFASKGMQYGYEFASKGEEVGEMANRVLWMASEIGIMADRIGEMADRIVHTEHLIVQTAMLIQNFGLLIDGTIKHMSESILYSLTLLLGKEFKPLQTTDEHLKIISEITKEIIKNNHEYDLAVLQKQSDLRNITISALDKINKKY
jgi:hypothetical protein